MAIYNKYSYQNDGTALTSNDDFANMAIGTLIERVTGEVFTKSAAGIFNKVSRKILSQAESDARYVNVDGDTGLSGTIRPASNNSCVLGGASYRFTTVYATTFDGTATSAKYADLAEKYLTDREYPIGTVLEVGGDKEATLFNGGVLAGVVSGAPGMMLNKDSEGQYVALKGKVPVFTQGQVKKGQYCIAVDGGRVIGIAKGDILESEKLNIVGVALEDSKNDSVMVKV